MYADRHARHISLDPASLGLSATLVGAIMAGLIFSVPDFVPKIEHVFIGRSIPLAPPPPPDPKPLPKQQAPQHQPVTTYQPEPTVKTEKTPVIEFVSQPTIVTPPSEGTGTAGVVVTPAKPAPVIIAPGINPRFNYQPEYPSDERRMGHEGRVVVRVLVGTDGRVKQVEKVSAASDSFFEATRRRALEKWRLTPATRDGTPIEAWRTMAVSFVMTEQ